MHRHPLQDRVSDFDLKLLTIESETLSVPDEDYTAVVGGWWWLTKTQGVCTSLQLDRVSS